MFAILADFLAQIQEMHLLEVVENDESLVTDISITAQAEIESFLRGNYDVAKIFFPITSYSGAVTYAVNDVVRYNDLLYVCKLASTNNLPTNANYWEQRDMRSQLILMYLVDIALYHLHSRIMLNNIPQLRIIRYEQAISWLEAVSKGKLSPDLPIVENTLPNSFKFISTPANQWQY
jgi:phage gp36-like protein